MLMSYSLSGSVLIDLLALAIGAYLYWGYRSYLQLSHIPGPKLWGWSLLPLVRIHLTGEIYDKFGELNEKYGPLVRIAPRTLLVSDPDVLRRMSGIKSTYSRAPWYIAMRLIPGQDNVLSTIDDKRHDELRRMMGMGYSGKENLTLEQDIDDCVRDLVNLLDTKYTNKGSENNPIQVDLAQKIQFFTSDVMSKVSFDAKFNDLRDDRDNFGYINEVVTVFPNMFCTCVLPSLLDFFTRIGLLQLLSPDDSSTHGFGKILAICKEQVGKRFSTDGKLVSIQKDMLGSFLNQGLPRRQVEQEAVLQLAAGSDTTATGLRATMLCLMQNPRCHAKLVEEINSAMTSGLISPDVDAIVTNEQTQKLPYLRACIREGLRWWPPIAGMLPKYTPPQGDVICGFPVPGGVSVAYSAKAVHHSPELYGPDPEEYRPERWIHTSEGGDEASWENLKSLERNNELIFGYGRYQCLGKSVAVIELHKVITELVKRYEMTLVNPEKPWETSCYGIHLQQNFMVTVKSRRSR